MPVSVGLRKTVASTFMSVSSLPSNFYLFIFPYFIIDYCAICTRLFCSYSQSVSSTEIFSVLYFFPVRVLQVYYKERYYKYRSLSFLLLPSFIFFLSMHQGINALSVNVRKTISAGLVRVRPSGMVTAPPVCALLVNERLGVVTYYAVPARNDTARCAYTTSFEPLN